MSVRGATMVGCACGCGYAVASPRKYLDGHRQRAYRKRVKRQAEAVGVPASLSLAALRRMDTTRERNGDAERQAEGAQTGKPKRKRQPEVRLTYAKAAEAASRAITAAAGLPGEPARECADFWLQAALTDKQRAALQRREGRADA